jgi:hypothetical protein
LKNAQIAVIAIDSDGDAVETHVKHGHTVYWVNLDANDIASIEDLDPGLFDDLDPQPIRIDPMESPGTFNLAGPYHVKKNGNLNPTYTYTTYLGAKTEGTKSNNDTIDVDGGGPGPVIPIPAPTANNDTIDV